LDLIDFGGAEILGLTTMNVHHIDALGSKLFELRAELLCQENTRSNNHKRVTLACHLHTRQDVLKDAHGLAATCWYQHNTLVIIPHSIHSTLLMGA